jgi:hypothetical protein
MTIKNPTLTDESQLTITINALTVHAAFSRLWVSPPSADGWQDMKEVATGGSIPRSAQYTAPRQTLLAWRLSVGSTRKKAEPYRIALTITQQGTIIQDGVLIIDGVTGVGGTAVNEDFVTLL